MKNIIRFNDLTTMECSGFTPTLIDNVDALIIEFHYENFIDMNEHSVTIYRKFKDEFALKKLELVDEQGNAISAAYMGFGDAKLSTQTPDSGSHTKDYIVFVQLKKLMDIEAKISALNIVVEQMREKIDPVTDFSKMTLEELQEYKCKEIQDEISHFIEKGTDVDLPGGAEHFSLSTLDQLNIDKLTRRAELFQVAVPYHSDKNSCRVYTPKEMSLISLVTDAFVTQFTTLINAYNIWIRRCTAPEEILAITASSELPEDLQKNMEDILTALNEIVEAYKKHAEVDSIENIEVHP
ncbi:hypothetical protein NSA48_02435 [Frisingicoccus caecimuris]|uniref:Uncharacterized protein n=1 Tax=Frisingicoccus caecimuris TaxID=1796636 RepID=A0A4R2LEL2_9FIRM|nr:hypothetical protein [Frisingicoccus caecimuris]MCR1917897.1 hypothetical protein [Frisingicoccus caecimuris]TCO86552.1 hypothetical protein EV212_101343 [Frisingicoccus caecimuris]